MKLELNKPLDSYGDDEDISITRCRNKILTYKQDIITGVWTIGVKEMAKERKRQTVESSFAEAWKPEKVGDTLEGIYRGFDTIPAGRNGSRSFISYKIQNEETGKIRGVASAMLKTKFNQVPKGAYVWLEYLGEVETENGPSKDYKLDVEAGVEMVDPFKSGEDGDLNDA